jgi:sec-independent protein translocase protein TatC
MKKLWRLITAPFRWIFHLLAAPFVRPYRAARDFFFSVPDDTPITDTVSEVFDDRQVLMSLFAGLAEHIDALRRHLLRCVIALAITTTICVVFTDRLVQLLSIPLGMASTGQTATPADLWQAAQQAFTVGQQGMERLQVIEPTEAVGVFMRVALLAGFVLAMPWIILEAYLFIAPGLMPRSRILLLVVIPTASVLFLSGIAFTYFIMLPAAVPFLYTFMGFRAAWRPSAYFDLITNLMFWVGVAFQMPLVVYALAMAGLLRARQLASQWRFAVIGAAVASAMITPTTDPVNMALVMAPMMLLYVVSIVAAKVAETGRQRRNRASAA